MVSVGFKEWALVCEALGRGEQCLLLRKGGIAEGRDGFAFKHGEFFLVPTFFHEQVAKIRGSENEIPAMRQGEIEIRFLAKIATSGVVTDWEKVVALEPFHVLKREVVRERYEYEGRLAIHVAFVRVYRLAEPWHLPELPGYGGCRSWVGLPKRLASAELTAVLSDREHEQRGARVKGVVAFSSSSRESFAR